MIIKVLTATGIVFSIVGTILTLWTTFLTSTKYAGTWHEMSNRHSEFPKEKKRIIIGVIVIAVGGVLQIIGLFL